MTMHKNALSLTLPSDREILLTRFFDAPRELVFKAMTSPDLIPRWWGPRDTTVVVDKMDVRPGGMWRYETSGPGGSTAFRGEYREIVQPERLVYTFEWEGMPGHVQVETVTFDDVDGRTKVTDRTVFDSQADRDGMLQSGMESGATQSMDRMEELLAELRANQAAR
jgi:uncharacterized protein YndB with AHSA1/START domain